MKTMDGKTAIFSRKKRYALGLLCLFAVLLALAGAVSIPFLYESQSILYKLGSDKVFLRSGKILGLLAAALLLFQLILAGRVRGLDRIFGLNRLYRIHRINAVTLTLLALFHPLLVFAPEDITSIPVELKFWPEVLGVLLLVVIILMTSSGLWRMFLRFSFHRWWLTHRAAAFAAVAILTLHVLNVSDTFESGRPRQIIVLAITAYGLMFVRVKMKPLFLKKNAWDVSGVTKAGKDTWSVVLSPRSGQMLSYVPGQFAFLTFQSSGIPAEEHPFTISSAPSRPGNLEFTIRCSGDWTELAGRLKPGDTALVDGPYGQFSHLFIRDRTDVVMIAGGVGITPMLSMIRYMADRKDGRRIRLIWSNRTKEDILYADELEDLETRLPGLEVTYILTRLPARSSGRRRLNSDILKELLSEYRRNSAAFVCGPPLMMKQVRQWLLETGFEPGSIRTEEFRL